MIDFVFDVVVSFHVALDDSLKVVVEIVLYCYFFFFDYVVASLGMHYVHGMIPSFFFVVTQKMMTLLFHHVAA